MASVDLDYIQVRIFDPTVSRQILTEISARHWLIQLAFDQCLVRLGHTPITVGVTLQEPKRDVTMGLSIAVDVLGMQSQDLLITDPGELGDHAIATEGDRSNCRRPA